MKIRFFGFEWERSPNLTIDEIVAPLLARNGQIQNRKLVALHQSDGYWQGIFIKIKDFKAFCKVQQAGGTVTVTHQELEKGSKMADFNFFIVNGTTGRGLYQHYHQSTGLNPFGKFCQQEFYLSEKARKKRAVDEAEQRGATKKEIKSINNGFDAHFSQNIICRPQTFNQLVNDMREIKQTDVVFKSNDQKDPLGRPMSDFAKKVTMRMLVENKQSYRVKRRFRKWTKSDLLDAARVYGTDAEGIDVAYSLTRNYANFGELEYDDVIGQVKLDFSNIIGSIQDADIIKRMMRLAKTARMKAVLE